MSREQQNTPTNTPTYTNLHQPCKSVQSGDCKNCNNHIEEMAKEVCGNHYKGDCVGGECVCDYQCVYATIANRLYNAGYRKQEWISVYDRLPEVYEDVLYFNGQSVGVDFICSDGTWCDEEVHGKPITHWMPLPEAPNMKGGAE